MLIQGSFLILSCWRIFWSKRRIHSESKFQNYYIKKEPPGQYLSTGAKVLRIQELTQDKGLSVRGLQVAEDEESVAVDPDVLEAVEVPVEVAVRVGADLRNPVATASVFPERFLLVKGSIPVTFRQLLSLLFEDETGALSSGVDRAPLTLDERHPFLGSGGSETGLPERLDAELVAGLQNPAGPGEVLVRDIFVVEIELLAVPLLEARKIGSVIEIGRHFHDSEVSEDDELVGGGGRFGGNGSRRTIQGGQHGLGLLVAARTDDLLDNVGVKTGFVQNQGEFVHLAEADVTHTFRAHDFPFCYLSAHGKRLTMVAGNVARLTFHYPLYTRLVRMSIGEKCLIIRLI